MHDARETVMGLIFGRWRSQILYNGVRLGVFEAVTDQPRAAADLAAELGLEASCTYRLLRALGSLGLLSEHGDRSFSITAAGEFLQAEHAESLRAMTLLEEGPEHYASWKHLGDIIRESSPDGFVREFGHPIFVHAERDPEYRAIFDDAMNSYSGGETQMVLEALKGYDFASISHVCDIAGGQGHLLCNLLARNQHLRGTVYELESALAREDLLWAEKLGVGSRCEYVAGDMFERVPEADAYILKHILHDWNDDEGVQILTNMHERAPAAACAFVAEFIVPGPETPHFAKLFDVDMMCCTTGRERTEQEYAGLFERAGWKFITTWYPPSRIMGVVEARKG